MKLGFPIEVRPRLSFLWWYIVSLDTCFGTHCVLGTCYACPNPRACINWYQSEDLHRSDPSFRSLIGTYSLSIPIHPSSTHPTPIMPNPYKKKKKALHLPKKTCTQTATDSHSQSVIVPAPPLPRSSIFATQTREKKKKKKKTPQPPSRPLPHCQ